MSILYGRENCPPGYRIEGLRRYAFIGDSFTYGYGVAPDQTLPAVAERQMNYVCSCCPVEAINFGINGYNLWNSWLAFKAASQVYDGLIIILCCNDMELFGRTYCVEYQLPRSPTWEKTHPCGQAVESCFEDISAFSMERSLPIAVCYYNLFDTSSPIRIGEIIASLCASYGFPFIDSLVPITDLNCSRDDLRVGEADDHPSARVHETVGRYLVQKLRRQGWFGKECATASSSTADRILLSARAMIEMDQYPPQVAQHWALRTLEIKLHRDRRLEASAAGENFAAVRSRQAAELAEINRYWHVSQRIRAFIGKLSSVDQGVAWAWCSAEEEALKLEELSFALGTGNWGRLAGNLPATTQPADGVDGNWGLDTPECFDQWILELQDFRQALMTIRNLPAATAWVSSPDTALLSADLGTLSRLADRALGECYRLKSALTKIRQLVADRSLGLAGDEIEHVSGLARDALRKAQKTLEFIRTWPGTVEQVYDSRYATFTTIQIAIRGKALEDKPVYMITVQAEYLAPSRLPFTDSANFFSDGSCKFVTLCVPLFYTGRLFFSVKHSQFSDRAVETEIIKIEVCNLPGQRRELPPNHFSRDQRNRLVSPIVYLY